MGVSKIYQAVSRIDQAVSKIKLAVSKIRIDQADSVAWTSAPSDTGAYTVQGITEITLEKLSDELARRQRELT